MYGIAYVFLKMVHVCRPVGGDCSNSGPGRSRTVFFPPSQIQFSRKIFSLPGPRRIK